MELIYYTIAAIVLYLVSDFILNNIEIKMGKRLPNRSFVFLIIITILATGSFNIIRALFAPPEPAQQTINSQIKQPEKENISPAKNKISPPNQRN